MGARILVVEDDTAIAMGLQDRLTAEGYQAEHTGDGDIGFRLAMAGGFDLLILDVMLPNRDGLSVCRDLRARGVHASVLMLTAKGETSDKVVGLKMGADDYLAKPFEMSELLARVEALLRRRPSSTQDPINYTVGGFELDLRRRLLVDAKRRIPLGKYEYRLLKYLCEHRNEVVDRDELLVSVWEYDSPPFTRTVDLHIASLRKKLGDSDTREVISTVRGHGYRLNTAS